ncbi:voltage-dependent anion channel-domain-containing protein [Penicillium lagena]|uniref:voltage-dependent anion channel-domain-containing protein n=1 Tax=Penicillium lagena TaxID=94218 RepID=UPI00253FCE48|nr:voltage-dependent anion channel-domain-containing protein [Penicillium lagena]KAJ5598901.1 voltage-dependent anion channel-domain-containing protein [Penicillium lagena]
MTPVWIFPAYPLLIIGPLAGSLCSKLEPQQSFPTILVGLTVQGVGFLVSLMVYSAFIYRLMSQKLPRVNIRPGMFVSVGPSGFTVTGMINLAREASRVFPKEFLGNGPMVAFVFLACNFFFLAATSAHWSVVGPGRLSFSMNWFSFVFPNTALVTATFAVGKAFSCKAINIVGCVMVFPLVLMYLFVCGMMIRAIALRHILWPQKGEDRDEGGFKNQPRRPDTTICCGDGP